MNCADPHPSSTVTFFLNGVRRTLANVSPDTMLIDWLRSPEVGLQGPKKPCGQGGCGSCTVVLSHWDEAAGRPRHKAINACLRPVCALNGLSVTTIEGTGRVGGAMNPVAHRLAENNGTQCGYCTNGWVMAMTGFLADKPPSRTKRDIEGIFDGNLCRCTGYRAILTGMKTFASDWSEEDEKHRMKCEVDKTFDPGTVAPCVKIDLPEGACAPVPPVRIDGGGRTWIAVDDVDALLEVARGAEAPVRLVHGNTSFGIYRPEVEAARTLIDIREVRELDGIGGGEAGWFSAGAGVHYADLVDHFADAAAPQAGSPLSALSYMARRTAGGLVRNAASLGGNTMLVLEHINEGDPFPSDLATALCGLGAEVEFRRISTGAHDRLPLLELAGRCAHEDGLADDLLLVRYHVPAEEDAGQICLAQKVALREVNSHTIVNATSRLTLTREEGAPPDAPAIFGACTLIFGGIAPLPWEAVETAAFLRGRPATLETGAEAAAILYREVNAELRRWAARPRRSPPPDEGFTDEYRNELVRGFLFKAFVNAVMKVAPGSLPNGSASAGVEKWGDWPVSDGRQTWQTEKYMAPVSFPFIKLMAMYQAQGEVKYTHEAPVPVGTLYGAVVGATRAVGRFRFRDPETGAPDGAPDGATALAKWMRAHRPGFEDLITAGDIPKGGSNMQGMAADQPVFAPGEVAYQGQCLAMVLAESQPRAEELAREIEGAWVAWDDAGCGAPVLGIPEALKRGCVFPDAPDSKSFIAHIWKVLRPGSDVGWTVPRAPDEMKVEIVEKFVDGAACKVVASGQACGAQLHFYMETQSCVVEPQDGGVMLVHPSTQSPTAVHDTVCSTLGLDHNQIGIEVRQLGGAFGGKTEPSRFVPAAASVGAFKTGRPVHLALDRETDSAMVGRRHPYLGQYQLAVDLGASDPDDKGLIRGLNADIWGDGGAFYDCSFVVSDCVQLRIDNGYYVPNYCTTADICRTSTAPNTAYRSFGDIQGTLLVENAIEDAAVAVEMDAADLREKNLYRRGQSTPGGQVLEYCYLREVWDYTKETSDFDARRDEVARFNAENRWRKRGICLMPVKYGSGFNLTMLEQAGALAVVYSTDGGVLIRQGGVDMGQGMLTKIVQIAAYELGVAIEIVRVDASDTRVIPNPTATGASTGTQYNGEAVRQACAMLRERLEAFCQRMRRENGEAWCKDQGIDWWTAGAEGWRAKATNGKTYWQNVVAAAYSARVSLQAQVNARMQGGEGVVPGVVFKPLARQPTGTGIPFGKDGAEPSETVNEYVGFTYNVGCVEAEVDILTGEMKIKRADLVYDMGKSLNPAIDIGQVEGAFVQGLGYLTTEKMVFEPEGDEAGRLNTGNTWRYKPPAVTTIPLEMNVSLFPRERAAHAPENPNTLFSSKEVGEPPLVLANAAFFAIKGAVRASRVERGLSPLFAMEAPATVQEVRRACALGPGGEWR